MKKEVLVAILIGLSLGLVVTYGMYRAKTSLTLQQAATSTTDTRPTPSGNVHNALSLLAPIDESLQTTPEAKVTGTTDPESLVIIFINDKPSVIRADASGGFSLAVTLDQGSNVVVVRTVDDEGNTAEIERTVIVSAASLDEIPSASSSAQATSSAKPSPKPSLKPSPGV